jgi:type II secretory pathway pseudopilin PulG
MQRARRRDDETGFTIVELVVALGLMSIVAASLAGVFWSSIRTAGNASHRSDAASIASREIEEMRSFQYTSIGFYADETGYTTSFVDPITNQTLTTVTLGATTPSGTPSDIQPETPDPSASSGFNPDPDPTNAAPITQGGVNYTVNRYVGWVDASPAYPQAYKRTVVMVSWTDQAGAHVCNGTVMLCVIQTSIVYPGGLGKYNGPEGAGPSTTTSTSVFTLPGQPTLNSVTVAGPGTLAVSWSAPTSGSAVTTYSVEYSTDNTFPPGNFTVIGDPTAGTLASSIFSYNLNGLADSTTYYVEVIAYSGDTAGQPSLFKSATTPAPPPVCNLGALGVAGATSKSTTGTKLTKTGRMSENLTVTWSTSGSGFTPDGLHQCSDSFGILADNSGGGADPGAQPYGPLFNNGSGSYNLTIGSNNQKGWATGVHTFSVWDNTTGSATTVVKTFQICAWGAASC